MSLASMVVPGLSGVLVLGALVRAQDVPPAGTPAPAPAAEAPAAPKESKINAGTFGAFSARAIGPAFMSGRIGDFAVNPRDPSEIYAVVCSGGLWKTRNRGITWSPIFDSYGSFSLGCVTIDPTNPAVVWVGSGENNSQRSVSFGDGVYVSRDGGGSFQNVGLKESEHIGMIAVHPSDPSTVYVAAQGPLWKSGGERGLYKTTDGGATWTRVLHVDDDTGINEIHLDPRDPDTLYASAYQRRRHTWTLVNGGPGSGIHKSTDGGVTWHAINSGLPGGDKGRIGLDVSPANPDVLYAIVEAEGGGVFRSTNAGATWEKRSDFMASSPQYYNEVVCDPLDADRVFFLDTFLRVSDDGGRTNRWVGNDRRHVDDHALWIDPADTRHLIVGGDGGIYETYDSGSAWRWTSNLPVTQFYRVAVDNAEPFYNVYGGTQDNNTQGGPSRTRASAGIRNDDWFTVVGGDGFEPAVDPTDPNIVYGQWQHGGLVRFDRKSGEQVDIKPREAPGQPPNVWNWDSPLIISPHSPTRLYFAGRRLFRSDDRGDSWVAVTGELHRGIDRNQLPVFGKVLPPDVPSKNLSTSIYGNCVSLSESPLVEGLIYVGTDDGLVHVTEDSGETWRKIENFPVVPEKSYVSCLTASRHSADRVYACFDNHKMGDFAPYILRSDDRGRTWKPNTGDLSPRDICYSIQEDHIQESLLFLGTEFGAYWSVDGGAKWLKVPGLPTIAVRDVEVQRRENDLVLATFGRGFYIVDDYAPIREINDELLEQPAAILPIKPALFYIPRGAGSGSDGATPYAASNPPFGATITYHLKDGLKSRRDARKEDEKDGEFTYATIEQLRAEDREQSPAIVLTIRDASGSMVREFTGSSGAGIHRAQWNLRYPSTHPADSAGDGWSSGGDGPYAPPGEYSVTISKLVDGQTTVLAGPRSFTVKPLDLSTFAASGEAARTKFEHQHQAQELRRRASSAMRDADEAMNRLAHIRRAIMDTPGLSADLKPKAEALRMRLDAIQVKLRGDPTLGARSEPEPPSILERISWSLDDTFDNTQPPTKTQRQQLEYATTEFDALRTELAAAIDEDLAAIEKALDDAGAPHTPGRSPWRK